MKVQKIINYNFNEHLNVTQNTVSNISNQLEMAANQLANTLNNEGSVFWMGNGGSCADAQHLAAELTGRFKEDRKPLNSISLTADTAVLTAIANDYSFKEIYARQIEALAKKGDLVIAISTSGESPNIIEGLKKAKELGLNSIAFLGNEGGLAKSYADLSLIIPSKSTARIQELHILIGHILVELVETILGLKSD